MNRNGRLRRRARRSSNWGPRVALHAVLAPVAWGLACASGDARASENGVGDSPATVSGPSAAIETSTDTSSNRQSLEEAWWTGPLLAPNAATLPHGHYLIEPYFFDAIPQRSFDAQGNRVPVPHANNFGSQGYALYGLTDRISVGLIPRFGFDDPSVGHAASHPAVGDIGFQGQYGLTQFHEGGWVPATSVVLGETLPTGKYDRLGDRPADGLGAGVFATTLGLYSQYYFWLPTGRILRTRLDLSYAIPGSTSVRDASVYGTPDGFRGRASPGNSFLVVGAGEYSVTRHWVLAFDVSYEHDANTKVVGSDLPVGAGLLPPEPIRLSSGPSRSVNIAPAIEYNFTNRVGIIAGAKLTVAGRNTSAVLAPVAAVNMVL